MTDAASMFSESTSASRPEEVSNRDEFGADWLNWNEFFG